MHPILKNLSMPMFDEEPSVQQCTMYPNMRRVSKKEWDTVLHPSGKWSVDIFLDERACKDEDDDVFAQRFMIPEHVACCSAYTAYRRENFAATTSLLNFAKTVLAGPCYGVFEGLRYLRREGDVDIYEMLWGT